MRFTRFSLAACLLLLLYASFVVYPRWKQQKEEAVIAWDVAGYYWYLPAVFIYQDLKELKAAPGILQRYEPVPDLQFAFRHETSGHYVLKYSSGTAFAMLPAFAAAHGYCRATGRAPADGFSPPYHLALQVWWIVIAFAGLVLFSRFIRRFYSDAVTAWVLFLLVFASNYLNWAAIDVGQTHALLFTLYATLLLATDSFYRRPSLKKGTAIGLLVGYLTLIRPSELLSLLIPVLWSLESLAPDALKRHARWLGRQGRALLAAALAGAAVVFIQLAYWKYVSGEWIVYSYGDQGFSFLHPHFKDYTFDWARGWLIYAPVMVFAIAGIAPFLRSGRNRVAILSFTVLNYYVVASWDVWQYGSRAMIQSYAVMGVLLAAFVSWVLRQPWRRVVFVPVLALLVYYNVWWTYFAHGSRLWPGGRPQDENLLNTEQMTDQYFRRIVGRWALPAADVVKLLDTRHIYEGPSPRPLWQHRETTAGSSWPLLELNGQTEESAHLLIPVPQEPAAAWLRVNLLLTGTQREWSQSRMPEMLVRLRRSGAILGEEGLRVHRFLDNYQRKNVFIDLKLDGRQPDSIDVFLRANGCPHPLRADSLHAVLF